MTFAGQLPDLEEKNNRQINICIFIMTPKIMHYKTIYSETNTYLLVIESINIIDFY